MPPPHRRTSRPGLTHKDRGSTHLSRGAVDVARSALPEASARNRPRGQAKLRLALIGRLCGLWEHVRAAEQALLGQAGAPGTAPGRRPRSTELLTSKIQ